MPQTYPSIAAFTAGQTLTAAQMNDLRTWLANQRVPPMCKVRRTSNLTSYTTSATIDWQAVSAPGFDTDSMWSASAPSRITVNTAGVYLVTFTAWVTYSGTITAQGPRISHTSGATTVVVGRQVTFYSGTSGADNQTCVAVVSAAANDYFTADYVMSGSSSNAVTATDQTYFSAAWVGQAA